MRDRRTLGNQLAGRSEVTRADVLAGLSLIPDERARLDLQERELLETAMNFGGTWAELADALGYGSGDALRQRYRRLGGKRSWPAGRPVTPEQEGA